MLTEWGKKKNPLNILNVEYKDKSELFLFAQFFFFIKIGSLILTQKYYDFCKYTEKVTCLKIKFKQIDNVYFSSQIIPVFSSLIFFFTLFIKNNHGNLFTLFRVKFYTLSIIRLFIDRVSEHNKQNF